MAGNRPSRSTEAHVVREGRAAAKYMGTDGDKWITSTSHKLGTLERLRSSERRVVPGVCWHSARSCWQVSWYEEKEKKRKYFPVHRFKETSETFCEVEADALCAAIEFRKGLDRRGIVKLRRVENPCSGVKGINWHTSKKAWTVRLNINGKRLCGGMFKPKDSTPEEVERARLLAVESRCKLERKCFSIKQSGAPLHLA